MTEPTLLKPVINPADPDVVDTLEGLLEDAKAGKLLEFVLVGRHENIVVQAWAGQTDDVFTMFGKVMDMAMTYREKNIE